MSIETNKQLVTDAFSALSSGDTDTFMDKLSDDIRWTIIGTTVFSGAYQGKTDLAERLFGTLVPQLESGITVDIRSLIGEGDTVIAECRGQALTKTGRAYNNTYCFVLRIEDGKIRNLTEYLDTELVTTAFEG